MGQKTNVLSLRSQPCIQQWQTSWKNSHCYGENHELFHFIERIFKKFYLNRIYIRQTHKGLYLQIEIVGVYPIISYPNFNNLKSCVQVYTRAPKVEIQVSVKYLPKTLLPEETRKAFYSYRREVFFWQSLLLIKSVYNGFITAKSLAIFLDKYLRRNRKRRRFLSYLKNVLDWHTNNKKDWQIQGLRIEVKGRFTPKSRTRKEILSSGSVSLQTLKANLDYANLESYTIFGSLGIKVWICSYVATTKKNKI
jgi:hypothetical protein